MKKAHYSVLCHNKKTRGLTILVSMLSLVLALSMMLSACNASPSIDTNRLGLPSEIPYESPYNWEGLTVENGRFAYSEEGQHLSRAGIDVSAHQGSIDWQSVAADGIEFAFIRMGYRGASEGLLNLDEFFEANISGAANAGIDTGVYFFSQALNEDEAREEAQFLLDHLGGRSLQYPIAYDFEPVYLDGVEGRANTISAHQQTSNARAFCEVIEAAGYPTLIYGNAKDIGRYFLDALDGRPIWFAEYDASYPSGQFDFVIWQYSSTGQVAGIATNVDMNIELIYKGNK